MMGEAPVLLGAGELQDLPFKASLETRISPTGAAQIVRYLSVLAKQPGTDSLLVKRAHVDIAVSQPNLPPTDYVYITHDFIASDPLLQGARPIESGPIDGVRSTSVTRHIGGKDFRVEIFYTLASRFGLAHMYPLPIGSLARLRDPAKHPPTPQPVSAFAGVRELDDAVKCTKGALEQLVAAQRALAVSAAERDELDRLRAEVAHLREQQARWQVERAELLAQHEAQEARHRQQQDARDAEEQVLRARRAQQAHDAHTTAALTSAVAAAFERQALSVAASSVAPLAPPSTTPYIAPLAPAVAGVPLSAASPAAPERRRTPPQLRSATAEAVPFVPGSPSLLSPVPQDPLSLLRPVRSPSPVMPGPLVGPQGAHAFVPTDMSTGFGCPPSSPASPSPSPL